VCIPALMFLIGQSFVSKQAGALHVRMSPFISPRNHVHTFRLSALEEIDAELAAWIAEAYLVGEQRHLRSSLEDPPRELSGQSQVSPS
jgi:hypothetical protein